MFKRRHKVERQTHKNSYYCDGTYLYQAFIAHEKKENLLNKFSENINIEKIKSFVNSKIR